MTNQPILLDPSRRGKIRDPQGSYITHADSVHLRNVRVKKLIHAPQQKENARLDIVFGEIAEIVAPDTPHLRLAGLMGPTILTTAPIEDLVTFAIEATSPNVTLANPALLLMPFGNSYLLTDGKIGITEDTKGDVQSIIAAAREKLALYRESATKEYHETIAALADYPPIIEELAENLRLAAPGKACLLPTEDKPHLLHADELDGKTHIIHDDDASTDALRVDKLIHTPRNNKTAKLFVWLGEIAEIVAPDTPQISLSFVGGLKALTLPPLENLTYFTLTTYGRQKFTVNQGALALVPYQSAESRERYDYILTDGTIYLCGDVKGDVQTIIDAKRQELAQDRKDAEADYNEEMAGHVQLENDINQLTRLLANFANRE